MKRIFLALCWLLAISTIVSGFDIPPTPTNLPAQAIQDPTTKVIYYLESDRRHVSAIDPDGKILWCSEIVSEAWRAHRYVQEISLDKSGEKIRFMLWVGGETNGTIEKATGKIWRSPLVQ